MKFAPLAASVLALMFSSPAFALGDDPCYHDKATAKFDGQQIVVNCYLDAAIAAYQVERKKIQAETPSDKEGSDARWEAMAYIDLRIEELELSKLREGQFTDFRKDVYVVSDAATVDNGNDVQTE